MVYFVYSLCKVVDLRLRYNEPNCYAVRLELTCKVGNLLKFKIVLKLGEQDEDTCQGCVSAAAHQQSYKRLATELAGTRKAHGERVELLSTLLAHTSRDAEKTGQLLAVQQDRCQELSAELTQAHEDNNQTVELVLAERQHNQSLSAQLAKAQADAERAHKLLAAKEERCDDLSAELAQTQEDNTQMAELILAEKQQCQQLSAELAKAQADAQNAHKRLAAKEQGCSPARGKENVRSPLQEMQQNNSHPPAHVWDNAQDVERSLTNTPAALGTGGTSSEMDAKFRDCEEWQQLCSAATSEVWLISPDQVDKQEVIGQGSFGVTDLGTYDKSKVAVKCVRIERDMDAACFLRETSALAQLRHPNILAFKGAVIQAPQGCWLISEYLPGGSLTEWLYDQDGMQALETAESPVLHRDLKPQNVLLDAAGRPKIADFGLCRQYLEDEAYTYTEVTGSYTYMSPEMMRGKIYGLPTDVYSFAILAAETFRQRPPYEEYHATPMQVAHGAAYQDLTPAILRDLPAGLGYLLEVCWEDEPEARPTFSMIVSHLSDTLAALSDR